jgi:hypothetical protein
MKHSGFSFKRWTKRGTAVLEFALCFPIFICLVFFLIDFLRYYFIQETLSYQVREGLRAGVVFDYDTENPEPPPTPTPVPPATPPPTPPPKLRRDIIVQAVKDSNLAGFKLAFVGGDSVGSPDVLVTITDKSGNTYMAGEANEQVTLTMAYQNFTFLTPFIGVLFSTQPTGSIKLEVTQSFQNES